LKRIRIALFLFLHNGLKMDYPSKWIKMDFKKFGNFNWIEMDSKVQNLDLT